MTTIYDVAKEAGVSPKTVSRVINRDSNVRAKTTELVAAAIQKLGYVPSNAARMMRSNRSGIVGMIPARSATILIISSQLACLTCILCKASNRCSASRERH